MAAGTANPATELLALLIQWHVPGGNLPPNNQPATGARVRHVADEHAEDVLAWRQQATAVRLVVEIDGQLRALAALGKPVSMYQAVVPRWYQAAFAWPTNWQVSGAAQVISPADSALLDALAGFLAETTLVGAVSDADLSRIRTAINEAEQVVRDAGGVAAPLRRYILGLFAEAASALDDAEVGRPGGQVNLRRATTQLHGLLNQTADELGNSSLLGARLRELARQIGGFGVGVALGIATNVGSGIAQNAIDGPAPPTHVIVDAPAGHDGDKNEPKN